MSSQERFNLTSYCPQRLEEAVRLDNLKMPDRVFSEDQDAKWETTMTPAMVVIANLVHRDYPDTFCQVQMSPDPRGRMNVMFLHAGEIEDHMPEDLVEDIFIQHMAPQIIEQIRNAPIPNN